MRPRVLTVSERSKRDIVELYGVPPESDRRDAERRRPGLRARAPGQRATTCSRSARSSGARTSSPRSRRLRRSGLPLVVVGPEKDPALARELREGGATLRGYVAIEELAALYRGAACLVQASRYEGFGLPVLEAMASGTPVVTVPDEALLEVVGDAAVVVADEDLADGIRTALARARARSSPRGSSGRACFSWRAAAERTVAVYPEVLGTMSVSAVVVSHGHAAELERSPAGARSPQVDEIVVVANLPGLGRGACPPACA